MLTKNKFSLLGLLSCYLALALISNNGGGIVLAATLPLTLEQDSTLNLGGGYFTREMNTKGAMCLVKPQANYSDPPHSFDRQLQLVASSRDNIQDLYFAGIGAPVGPGFFISFMAGLFFTTDDLTRTYLYVADRHYKDAIYDISSSTPRLPCVYGDHSYAVSSLITQTAADHLCNEGPDGFRRYCGDSYLSKIHSGAELFVAINIHFDNTESMIIFNEQLSVSPVRLVSVFMAMREKGRTKKVTGNVTITAQQKGGDPEEFDAFVTKEKINTAANCSLADLDQCIALAKAIETYAGKTFPQQLNKQIDPVTTIPRNASEQLNFKPDDQTTNYQYLLGMDEPLPQTTPVAVLAARRDLLEKILQTDRLIQRVDYLKKTAHTFTFTDLYKTFVKNSLTPAEEKLNYNLNILFTAQVRCFEISSSACAASKQPYSACEEKANAECLNGSHVTFNELKEVNLKELVLPKHFTLTDFDKNNKITKTQLFVYNEVATKDPSRTKDESCPASEIFYGALIEPSLVTSARYKMDVCFTDQNELSMHETESSPAVGATLTHPKLKLQAVANYLDGKTTDNTNYRGLLTVRSEEVGQWSARLVFNERYS